MKKFSIAALIVFSALTNTTVASAAPTSKCAFLPNAPDQHVVVKGDTLWGIAGKFLERPWCWPQVWGMNRDQIRNPHWIYPGQTVYFDRVNGKLRLGQPVGESEPSDVRLSPKVRISGLDKEPIPTIPASAIDPFLTEAIVVEAGELANSPRIVGAQENHVNIGNGDKAYVLGDLNGQTRFQVYRNPVPLKDPVTGKIIGFEAKHVGKLLLTRAATAPDEAHTFVVTSVREEMGVGDRLLPINQSYVMNYVPHAPEKPIDARVVSIYSGVTYAGQNHVISINRGKNDGLEPGAVLALWRAGKAIEDKTVEKKSWFSGKKPVLLPPEEYGKLFIFRVFDKVSYGLVMNVTNTVMVGDEVRPPE